MGGVIALLFLICLLLIYYLIDLINKTNANNAYLSQIKDQLEKVTGQLQELQKRPGTILSKEEKTVIISEIKIDTELKQVVPPSPVQTPKEEEKILEPEFQAEDFDERVLTESSPT